MPFVFEPHFPMWPKFPISKYLIEKMNIDFFHSCLLHLYHAAAGFLQLIVIITMQAYGPPMENCPGFTLLRHDPRQTSL